VALRAELRVRRFFRCVSDGRRHLRTQTLEQLDHARKATFTLLEQRAIHHRVEPLGTIGTALAHARHRRIEVLLQDLERA
jgi:hypothetical protein